MDSRLGFEDIADTARVLAASEAADLARIAGDRVDLDALDRSGDGDAVLLWRTEHSEAWLNTWWRPRDTGFHDHDGSCVGVYVLAGHATNEPLMVGGVRQVSRYGSGESFSLPGAGIHRMDHEPGAVTIHVYSPPIRSIGHFELVDGTLQRERCAPDAHSAPSTALLAAVDQAR